MYIDIFFRFTFIVSKVDVTRMWSCIVTGFRISGAEYASHITRNLTKF
jgi:hypothetical protein